MTRSAGRPDRGRPQHLRPAALLLVAAGGAAGAPVRYLAGAARPTPAGGWPVATFVVNLTGAFLLGVLLEGLARSGPDSGRRRQARLLLGTGFCGALTTYSTLAVETDLLGHRGDLSLAAAYLLASLGLGLLATAAGMAVGHRCVPLAVGLPGPGELSVDPDLDGGPR